MRKKTTESSGLRLLRMVWGNAQKETGHSWLKLNHALQETLSLAIRAGMEIRADELRLINKPPFSDGMNSGYWIQTENLYETAILYRNAAAYQAIEEYLGRKAFIIPGARKHINTGDGPAGNGLPRLFLGAEFAWNGERVRVTSFNDEEKTLTACSYKLDGEKKSCKKCGHQVTWPREKVLHRYTISHADIKAAKTNSKPREGGIS